MVGGQEHPLTGYGRLFRAALASRLAPRPAPFKLTVAVTGQCDARCAYCRTWAGEGVGGAGGQLTCEELSRLFTSLGPRLLWLDLTGGEPFLRGDIVDICRAALERCPRLVMLHLPTNGLAPARIVEACRRIAALGRARLVISVSVFGPPAVNDRLRRAAGATAGAGDPGAFERACETLRGLRAAGVEAHPGMTLARTNQQHLEETAAALSRRVPGLFETDLHINIFHDSGAFYGGVGDLTPTDEGVARALGLRRPDSTFALAEVAYLALGLEYLRRRLDPRLRGDLRSPIPCSALRGSAYVGPSGDLHPCLPWGHGLGSLRDHRMDLPALWRSAAARQARRALRQHQCPGCWTPCEAYQALLARPEHLLLGPGRRWARSVLK